MTDPTRETAVSAAEADPLDLEKIRARSAPTVHAPGAYDINRLIAAVEALRDDRDSWKTVADSYEADRLEQKTEIEALRGRVEELELSLRCAVGAAKNWQARTDATEAQVIDLKADFKQLDANAMVANQFMCGIVEERDAFEVHATELAGALGLITKAINRTDTSGEIRREHDRVKRLVVDALATLPAQALERARAKDEVVKAAMRYFQMDEYHGSTELDRALSNLGVIDMKHRGERAQEFFGEPEGMATHEQSDAPPEDGA